MPNSHMHWIKLYTDILDDPTIGRLPVSSKWRFIELLVLASNCDAEGYLVDGHRSLSIEDLAWRLRITPEELKFDLDKLMGVGLIEYIEDVNGGTWLVTNFSKRQDREQDDKRTYWRQLKRRQRARATADTDDDVAQESAVLHDIPAPDRAGSSNVLKDSPQTVHDDVLISPEDMEDMSSRTIKDNILDVLPLEREVDIELEKEGEKSHPPPHHHAELGRVLPIRDASLDHHDRAERPPPTQILDPPEFERDDSSPNGDRSDQSSQVMMTSLTPIQHFCQTFKIKILSERHDRTLKSLQSEHGAERLIQVIDWAADKDIPPDRALIAVKTAIRDWQDRPRNRSPGSNGSHRDQALSVFDQFRQELANGNP